MMFTIPVVLPTGQQMYKAHWRKYNTVMNELKEIVAASLLGLPRDIFADEVEVDIIVYQQKRMRRDCDNVFVKPVLDCVVDHGIIADDNWTIVKKLSIVIDYDKENPRTEVIIRALPSSATRVPFLSGNEEL